MLFRREEIYIYIHTHINANINHNEAVVTTLTTLISYKTDINRVVQQIKRNIS